MPDNSIKERALLDGLNGYKDGCDFVQQKKHEYLKRISDIKATHAHDEQNLKSDSLDCQSYIRKAKQILFGAKLQFSAAIHLAGNLIQSHKQKFEEALAHKRYFREKYGITREPDNPNALLGFAISTSLTVVEGVANSIFFLNSGLMPNAVEAIKFGLFLAATNIFISTTAGGFLSVRYLHESCTNMQKTLAKIGAISTIAVLGLTHYAVALVRATGNFDGLLSHYSSPSIILNDIHSILIVAVGVVLSIFACYKGSISFSDIIPNYAALQAQIDELETIADEIIESTFDNLNEVFEDSQESLQEIGDELKIHYDSLIKKAIDFNASGKSLKDECLHNLTSMEAEIASYTQSVKSIRPNLKIVGSDIDQSIDIPEFNAFDNQLIKNPYENVQKELNTIADDLYSNLEKSQDQLNHLFLKQQP